MSNSENLSPIELQPEITYQNPKPINIISGTAQLINMYFADELPDQLVAKTFLKIETIPFIDRAQDGLMDNFQSIRDPRKLSKEDAITLLEERRLTAEDQNRENMEAFSYAALTFGTLHSMSDSLLPFEFSSRMALEAPFTIVEYLNRIQELKSEVLKIATGHANPKDILLNNHPLLRTYLFFQVGKNIPLRTARYVRTQAEKGNFQPFNKKT